VFVTGQRLVRVCSDAIADFIKEAFACGWPAINQGNVEQDAVKIRLGDRCPQYPSHLIKNPFLCHSLAEPGKHLRVVERFG
jgi:hypothetical protein